MFRCMRAVNTMGNTAGMPADSPRRSPVELRNEDSGFSGSNENNEPDQSKFNSSPRRTNRRATRNASQCKQTTLSAITDRFVMQ